VIAVFGFLGVSKTDKNRFRLDDLYAVEFKIERVLMLKE
jgi:hypothetical protein